MEKERLQQMLQECLERLSIRVSRLDVHEEGSHTLFHIKTPDSGLLIGNNGDNLKALNLLMRRMLEKRLSPQKISPFIIDVNGYYSKKIKDIKQQAKLLGERARTFKADVEMNPMNAYERMIVHALFANDPEVYTQSVGEGRTRHIVIRYRTPEQNTLSADSKLLLN